MPTISFLILTYNSSSYIERLFNSIFKTAGDEIENGVVEVIIEDNASTDDTVTVVRKFFQDKKVLFSESKDDKKSVLLDVSSANNGYAKGINRAAKLSSGSIIVVINPDSEVIEFDLKKITGEFESNKNLSVAGFKIVDFNGREEKTAGRFFNALTFLAFSLGLENSFNLRYSPVDKTKVDYVSGGFVAFRRDAFEKLDGYDEDFFMYVEDMDICYRTKMSGQDVYFLPFATLKHKGQGSSSREFAIVNIYKGLQIYYKKHGSFLSGLYIKNLLSIKAALIIFIGTLLGKKELVATYSRALQTIV